jgi:hypothetical protein
MCARAFRCKKQGIIPTLCNLPAISGVEWVWPMGGVDGHMMGKRAGIRGLVGLLGELGSKLAVRRTMSITVL